MLALHLILNLTLLMYKYTFFVGHDYYPEGRNYPIWESSVSEQRASNIHVGGSISEGHFISMREDRDSLLPKPDLMHVALQANLRGGCISLPEFNGTNYLKIPLNKLA